MGDIYPDSKEIANEEPNEDKEEDLKEITKNYIPKLTEKNKKFYLEMGKYILLFDYKLYRCKFYKDRKIKCKAFARFDSKGQIIKYNNKHTCRVDEKKVNMLLVNNEIKTSIDNTSIPFSIKAKILFNTAQKKLIKRKNCEEHDNENIDKLKIKDKNHINVHDQWSSSFKNHKSVLYRYLNKSLPKDVENLEDMPSESEYYKTISNENFLAYKSDTMLIFMSKMQAQILYKKNEHIFIDGTFFSVPKAVYQVVTIRNHDLINDIFYTVAYSLLINKSMESYVEFLDQIKNYVYANRENKRILEYNDPINIHCDFEMAIIRAVKQVYPNTEIKLCLWHCIVI